MLTRLNFHLWCLTNNEEIYLESSCSIFIFMEPLPTVFLLWDCPWSLFSSFLHRVLLFLFYGPNLMNKHSKETRYCHVVLLRKRTQEPAGLAHLAQEIWPSLCGLVSEDLASNYERNRSILMFIALLGLNFGLEISSLIFSVALSSI